MKGEKKWLTYLDNLTTTNSNEKHEKAKKYKGVTFSFLFILSILKRQTKNMDGVLSEVTRKLCNYSEIWESKGTLQGCQVSSGLILAVQVLEIDTVKKMKNSTTGDNISSWNKTTQWNRASFGVHVNLSGPPTWSCVNKFIRTLEHNWWWQSYVPRLLWVPRETENLNSILQKDWIISSNEKKLHHR